MLITNSTGEHYLFHLGSQNILQLPAYGTLEIAVHIYSGNQGFQEQIDSLFEAGKVVVLEAPDGFPLSAEDDALEQGLPDAFEIKEQDFILKKEEGVAGFSVETNFVEGQNYGVVKLICSDGSVVELSSYGEEVGGQVYISIAADNSAKPFKIAIDGSPVVLDPGTATSEQIADALVALGLVEEV